MYENDMDACRILSDPTLVSRNWTTCELGEITIGMAS